MLPAPMRTTLHALLGVAALLLLAPPPGHALSGTVVDEKGKPIKGARACYAPGNVELVCVETDEAGYWSLPDSRLDRIRIVAKDYLPRSLAAVERDSPVALQPAATMLVRIVDAETGEGLDAGSGEVAYPSGRQLRFVTKPSGARLRTLEPGRVMVTGHAEGYLAGEPQHVRLVPGEEIEVEIRLRAEPPVSEES